jgi:Leucine-rich repeat (LRR) protein
MRSNYVIINAVILMLVLLFACKQVTENIAFEDQNLKRAVYKTGEKYAADIITLDCDNLNIETMNGIEHLTRLIAIQLNNNRLKDIKPVEKMKSITHLYLRNNQLTDIAPVTNLSDLSKLDIKNNNVSDLSPLKGKHYLTELYLSGNPIPVSQVEELRKLLPICKIYY